MNTVIAFQPCFRTGHKHGPRKFEGTEIETDTLASGSS
jgi:hypothetical protein